MNTLKTIALASSILAAGFGVASAQEAPIWSHSAYWEVRVDQSMGGCFMQASYQNILVRFGLKNGSVGYMAVASPDWSSLTPGQGYAMQLRFNTTGWATWTGFAHPMADPRHTILEFDFDNLNIWRQIMFAQSLHLSYQGQAVLDANLPGSADAAIAMAQCQKTFGVHATGPADPFRPPPAAPAPAPARRDPFIGA